jgi:hypothetical protein
MFKTLALDSILCDFRKCSCLLEIPSIGVQFASRASIKMFLTSSAALCCMHVQVDLTAGLAFEQAFYAQVS